MVKQGTKSGTAQSRMGTDLPRETPIFLSAKPVLGKAIVVHTEYGQLSETIAHCEALLLMRGQAYLTQQYDRIRSESMAIDHDAVAVRLSRGEDPDARRQWDDLCDITVLLCAIQKVLTKEPIVTYPGNPMKNAAVKAVPRGPTDRSPSEIHVMEW
jgi:hypothetical protein